MCKKALIGCLLCAPLQIAFAQQPVLTISPEMQLKVFGHTNNYYQIESSTNLHDWGPYGTNVLILQSPESRPVSVAGQSQYFRVRSMVYGSNYSVQTVCAEEDNVNISLRGDVNGYTVTAYHSGSVVAQSDCTPNFNNCTNAVGEDYAFTPLQAKPLDNGTDYLVVNRKDRFWRPSGMAVTVDGGSLFTDIHYIELGRKIPDAWSWPIFCALYCDGNMRLIPFPPAHLNSVCFGTSVIVGPAAPASRPIAEIASLDYRSASRTMLVTYRTGGSAVLDMSMVSRTNAVVKVDVNYPTDQPFCTVRSMYVADGNCDMDTVVFPVIEGVGAILPVMSFRSAIADMWDFYREHESAHNNSAPGLGISVY
ncbi:MAG TPA: hypothetical protein P5555_00360 [Candidatus Paceibacterota bacterium]|nr:hypothetical protein [Verrucomicrobiota bacterium]HRZ43623.1 hypothetical protein [Candidatus Paceibacterota bacterium]